MKQLSLALFLGIAIVLLVIIGSAIYTVDETEQVIITEFGRKVGDPVTEAGLKFKTPFIQHVNRIEKRVLEWDGNATEMPTRDKLFIIADMFGRWKITDASVFFEKLRDERSAISRLDDILGGETRTAVANHDLIEIIRSTKEREPVQGGEIVDILGESAQLEDIEQGRPAIEQIIFDSAKPKLAEFGIELLDIRFKRINYNPTVEKDIFQRMISERKQIAERFRSEGQGEAARILGSMEKDVNEIKSEAYKKVQSIRGEADAKATAIYANAYNQSPQAAEFYRFIKSLETYQTSLGGETTVILNTDSPLLQYLQSFEGNGN
ncbi:MAG: protease modulator HflC [Verrucomicrobiota bacterium]